MSGMGTGMDVNKQVLAVLYLVTCLIFFSMIGVSPGFRWHPISIMCHICHWESHSDHFMNQANQSFALQILALILWILKAGVS